MSPQSVLHHLSLTVTDNLFWPCCFDTFTAVVWPWKPSKTKKVRNERRVLGSNQPNNSDRKTVVLVVGHLLAWSKRLRYS